MSISLETTLLPAAAVGEASLIQTRAFLDDPVFAFVFPDESDRRARLPWLMRVGITLGARFGEVHTTPGEMRGHAVWLPPGATNIPEDRFVEAGFIDPEERLGAPALERFGTFMEKAGAAHERLLSAPHWYLMILGVDPPFQGQGLGGTLLQPVLARADTTRLCCYLETGKERNLAFYRKHGFEVAEEQTLAGGGPRVWMMIRLPR